MMPINPHADYGTLTLAAASDDCGRLAKRDNDADPVVRQGAFDIAVSLGAAFGFIVIEVKVAA
jgi:hypothetical protein